MTRRLEFHADHQDFFVRELERLSSRPLTWGDCWRACEEHCQANRFDPVVERFCRDLEWPEMNGADLARACARLHFAVWAVNRLPFETVEHPASGQDYLRRMLIEAYWLHRQQWIVESWAGVVLEDED
jgi:hypothetical protein